MTDAIRKIHLAVIRKHYPTISLQDMTLHAGREHYVYVVGETVIFRFPQVPHRIPLVRGIALDELAASGAIPFRLPTCEIRHDREFDLWFEIGTYLPGVALTPDVAASFEHASMVTIARQLATFLNVIHAFPLDRAREIGMDEMDPTDFWDYMENNPDAYPKVQRTLWSVLLQTERAWIEQLFERFIEGTRRTPFPVTVRHSDMVPDHIIVDPLSCRISGVIDFSWRIADPAGDFKAFEYYGQTFVDEVYVHYRHPVDPEFDRRRLFYTGHDEVFGLVRALDAGDASDISRAHASLSAYIRVHASDPLARAPNLHSAAPNA